MAACGGRHGLHLAEGRREVPSNPVIAGGWQDARGAAPGLAPARADSAVETDRFSGGAGRGPEGAPALQNAHNWAASIVGVVSHPSTALADALPTTLWIAYFPSRVTNVTGRRYSSAALPQSAQAPSREGGKSHVTALDS